MTLQAQEKYDTENVYKYVFTYLLTLKCLKMFPGVSSPGPRGYVPSSKLIRYCQAAAAAADPPPSPHLALPAAVAGQRRHSYSPETRSLTLPAVSRPCFQVSLPA